MIGGKTKAVIELGIHLFLDLYHGYFKQCRIIYATGRLSEKKQNCMLHYDNFFFSLSFLPQGLSKDKEKREENVRNSFWVYDISQNKWLVKSCFL